MSKVLLINPVIREFAAPNNPPLGLLYIAAVLERNDHECRICDLNALRWKDPDTEKWLLSFKDDYDYVGLSGLIVTYQEQRKYLDIILKHKEEFGNPILISGGGLATSVPDFMFKHMPELHLVAIGEGEMTMLELADMETPFPNIPGLQTNCLPGCGVRTPDRNLISDLDDLPFPAWDKVPMDVYLANPIWGGKAGNSSEIGYEAKRSANMIVSRGCPYNCNFCASSVFGSKYRMRSVKNVIYEICALKEKYDIDFVGFVDDNTTANRNWVLEFCEAMIRLDIGIKWGGSARVNAVDEELLKLMKEAGCAFLGFGIESASPKILKAMDKRIDPDMASNAIDMVRAVGIHANATFIAGYPGETRDTLRETSEFMRAKGFGNIFYATPYPGTRLYEDVKDKVIAEYGTEDAYIMSLSDATEFRVNLSEMLTGELIICRSQMTVGQEF